MRRMVIGGLTLCMVLPALLALAAQPKQTGSLIIDGAKNPELFPEWYVWEMVFQWIVNSRDLRVPLHVQLGIAEVEMAPLLREARSHEKNEALLAKEIEATVPVLAAKGKKEDEIRDVTQEFTMRYRHKILDARARMHQELLPETLSRLRHWMNKRLAGTQVNLRGRAREIFSKPW